jgi:uncharacterized protein (DUF1501 family)
MSRRDFLRNTCCTAAAGMAAANFSRLGLINAMAQTSSDYKALVCVFLFGGNDANNLFVPLNATDYTNYAKIRANLAIAQGNLLPVTPPSVGLPFGFHPRLAELRTLFNSKQTAVLANVGTLIRPTTRTQFRAGQVAVPQNLFSHSDQQQQMQTAALNQFGEVGWGGRLADKMQAIYGGSFPLMISLSGTTVFAEGLSARPSRRAAIPRRL